MNSAAASAAVKSVGEARPPRFVKYSVTSESESELAESVGEDSSSEKEERLAVASQHGAGACVANAPEAA